MKRSTQSWTAVGVVVFAGVVGSIHVAGAQRGTALAIADATDSDLNNALNDELSVLGNVRVTSQASARYVLHGSVTRLDVVRDGDRNRIDCEVSLLLSERRGGNVRLMLRGRAAGRGARVEQLTDSVLRAAVRGALRPLPEQLARR
jgi:hypothetical protein